MDLTPWVGIFGAIVGGSIGLVGQRMNIIEQRRKAVNDRVVEFIREVDLFNVTARRFAVAAGSENKATIDLLLPEMRMLLTEIEHRRNYVELTAPATIRIAARKLNEVTVRLSNATIDLWKTNDVESAEIEVDALQMLWGDLRLELVYRVKPDIDATPLWLRKPIPSITKLVKRPFTRQPAQPPVSEPPATHQSQ